MASACRRDARAPGRVGWGRVTGLLVCGLLCCPATAAAQTPHLLVIVGLAGNPEHAELFHKWAATLVDAATERFGVPADQVRYLAEKPEIDAKRIDGKSTREEIAAAFAALGRTAGADDPVFVVLVGHGTFDGRVAKFNLPGPDMTAAEFAPLVAKVKSGRLVFVNTASASGPFIEALSGPGRTIVTATRNGAERFSTVFGGYFVDALTSDAADTDKNRRVSVLEAFTFAKREVATAYEREGIMATEHALLDDSGDGEGSPEPAADGREGRVASILALGATTPAAPLPEDPALRALHEERRALERRVESLKLMKDSMEPQRYASELEKVLTDLALKTRRIRELTGK
jgi:hypothetical protein